ncbi:39S ribosomal protein L42, mitochondrial [Clupea harengus]|uniref:Large ribosomal subunit protein mL42 n=1 Tax=Clupea harengus TaxID=7950 RepID=A0A6P3VS62_CLUHA|nr:39S ribosomal protein L42, mitochondrial [Clupea harengus]
MAAILGQGILSRLKCLCPRFSTGPNLLYVKGISIYPIHAKSTFRGPAIDDSNVEIGVTSDGKTVVCYHPSVEFPYELSQPIPRPDPLTNPPETHDQVLKDRLSKESLKNKQAPTIEELSKMFYTTKHRWYPIGQYRMRRISKNPPKDRK